MTTFPEILALLGAGGALTGLVLLGCDVLRLTDRVRELELGNEREDADEKVLHDEGSQLRQELDDLHKAVKYLAKSVPRETLTSWDESDNSTREMIGPPSSRPGATIAHALRLSSPALPFFDNCDFACNVCKDDPCVCSEPVL